jgi:2-hydroxy-6-oxonona-2,4-dienedioate hydrolase
VRPRTVWRDEGGRARLEAGYERFRARVAPPTERAVVRSRLGPSHVLISGAPTNPPLVCLHAMRTSSAHLLSELNPLAARYRLVAPDLPGQSVKGPQVRVSLSDDTLSGWLMDVMDGLRLDSVPVLGVSWGGFLALKSALAHPDRVRRLILVVPAGIVNGSHWRGLAEMAIPMLRYRMRPSPANLSSLLAPILTTLDEHWVSDMGGALRDMKIDPRIPPLVSDHALSQLCVPTLVMGAEEDISFPGVPMLERVRAQVPSVETELLTASKHCPPTTPEFQGWMAERVARFLGA